MDKQPISLKLVFFVISIIISELIIIVIVYAVLFAKALEGICGFSGLVLGGGGFDTASVEFGYFLVGLLWGVGLWGCFLEDNFVNMLLLGLFGVE